MGYGYDYACEMFNNIGMIPSIEILGINAANEGFYDLMEEIFNRIEEDGGNIDG